MDSHDAGRATDAWRARNTGVAPGDGQTITGAAPAWLDTIDELAAAMDPTDGPITGEETLSRFRVNSTVPIADGQLRLVYFRARKTETINNVLVSCTTAAGATPTLIRFGVWSVASTGGLPTGDLTLEASTASDTTLLAAAQEYTKALSAPWAKVTGRWYAAGLLVKTAASAPSIVNFAGTSAATMTGGPVRPRLCALLSGQTNLPATITAASLSTTALVPYFLFTT